MRELHVLGAAVHGFLAMGHAIGILYNLRRRQWKDAAIHAVVFVYDLGSAISHHRDKT